MDTTFHANEEAVTHTNSICLFEFEEPTPMQRHSTARYISVSKNIAFYMRSISTVGNYDYTFECAQSRRGLCDPAATFSPPTARSRSRSRPRATCGVIRLFRLTPAQIQSAYWPAANGESGYRITEALSGSLHGASLRSDRADGDDHVLSYKIDFDIAGLANSFAVHAVSPVSQTYPWSRGQTRNSMKLERRHLANENEGRLDWPQNNGAMYMVVNRNATNKWGEARGYRIMPGRA